MVNPSKFYTNPKMIKELYRMAYVIHDVLIQNNIVYYAESGTLLGAMRHKGIINWDNDLDFSVSHNDIKKILNDPDIKADFKKRGCTVKRHNLGWLKVVGKHQCSADLFPIELVKINTKTKKASPKGEWVFQYSGEIEQEEWPNFFHNMSDVFPLKQVKFGKGIILVPNKPKKYLSRAYSSNWSKVGYLTQDTKEHTILDEPVKLKITKFTPAKDFYVGDQIVLPKNHPYLDGNIAYYLN